MQSASDTPSSHLWVLSCPADQRGVGHGSARRAHPGTMAVAERSHFGDLDVPKCITSTATLRLGRVYEYFLGSFAGAEGKRGGEFYTPRSVVGLLVAMLEPYKGRVYDPCCGSGGMFVQSERFVEEHGGRLGDIAIYGQESNSVTWRLAKMNLAVRGIDADIQWNNEGSFHKDALKDLKADFILANPPFNISDWGGERLREDVRWKYGVPPVGNAN
ncbi:MAG: N-6 DNA methylase, partial [Thiohalocapsa sp.]